jgi:hypothetical protein
MKKLLNEIALKGMKFKDKVRCYWFITAMMALGSIDTVPAWVIALVGINFILAAISVLKVKIKDEEEM